MQQKIRQNPEEFKGTASHALYNNHKQARKQIQNQRQQAQHTLSFLERQAKKTAKQLEKKQKGLISYYQLKQNRFIQAQKKQSLRRQRQAELQKMKKTHSLIREMSAARRSQAREGLASANKRSASSIKTSRIMSQRKKENEKQLQRQLLKKRNTAFSKALSIGTEHSKLKSFCNKRSQSSQVKNDLIYVQQNIKNRQIQKLSSLNARQKELVNIVEKNRKQKQYYEDTFQQFQTVPFERLYPSIRQEDRHRGERKGSSRRSSLRSESLLI